MQKVTDPTNVGFGPWVVSEWVRLRELVAILSARQGRERIYQKRYDKAHFPARESITMRTHSSPLPQCAAPCSLLLQRRAPFLPFTVLCRAMRGPAACCTAESRMTMYFGLRLV
jgi:hypothetical protein